MIQQTCTETTTVALNASFNSCRESAFKDFCVTLAELRGKQQITEMHFRDRWLNRLREHPDLFAEGWYDPPPYGISVLFASETDAARLCYDSLRRPGFWPGKTEADWNGFLFAYCSCVSRTTGLPGDFDLTLYFGDDPRLKAHYRNCFAATDKVLRSVSIKDTSRGIVRRAERIFTEAGLNNSVVSLSDPQPHNLGMSFPALSHEILATTPSQLFPELRDELRRARKFLNDRDEWMLEEGMQFTIEPQLRSVIDPMLPQISFHYLLRAHAEHVEVCKDIDRLIAPCLR